MPFQNSLVNVATKYIPPVILVTAGEDRIITCQDIITLEPTIIGDMTGHSVLWEQISGDPVNWLTPLNQIVVQYQQIINDDKQFRIWIDKGSTTEQTDTVWHYNTPIDDAHLLSTNIDTCKVITGQHFTNSSIFAIPIAEDNTGTCHPTLAELEFYRDPDRPELIERIAIEQFFIGSGWTEIDSIPNSEILLSERLVYRPISFNESYRVVAYYYNSSSSHFIQSVKSPSVSPQDDGRWLGNSTLHAIGEIVPPPEISNFTVTIFTIKQCVDVEESAELLTGNTNLPEVSNFNVITRTLKTCPLSPIEDDRLLLDSNDIQPQFENYNVLDLTGGEIGG